VTPVSADYREGKSNSSARFFWGHPMDRRTFVRSTAAAAASSILPNAVHAQPVIKAQNVVLIHGLFADGSCWSDVIARLQAKGIQTAAVQNPLTTLPESVASTRQVLGWQQGPTVLVAHSFGGMILTEAGVDPKVSALVYVAARAPDAGEDYTALAKRFPAPPASSGIVWSDDWGRLSEEAFLRDFAADVPAGRARVLYAIQAPFKRRLLADKTTRAAWRSKPSWYAVSTEDRTINSDLQRFMAKRMGAMTIEVRASHVSLISQPDTIADLILAAAGWKS
jgi:pimeloyl-ACP methyl ester carboxylesterase